MPGLGHQPLHDLPGRDDVVHQPHALACKGEPLVDSPLLQGRSWTLKLTSKDFSDWMESIFELHDNGVISRFTFRREGIVWRADAKELNAFTMPTCRK